VCQLTRPRILYACESTLVLLDATAVTAQQPRRAGAGCRGYGGEVSWCGRHVSMSHHHTPTGAFGVGDDLGGGAGSAARPLGGGGGGEGGATTLTVVATGGGGDVRDSDHRSYWTTLVKWLGGERVAVRESPAALLAATEVPVCRFCFDEADRSQEGRLISPCLCSGSQAHVHVRCLRTWHDTTVKLSDGFRCQVCRQRFEALPSRPLGTIVRTYTVSFVHYFAGFMMVVIIGGVDATMIIIVGVATFKLSTSMGRVTQTYYNRSWLLYMDG